MICDKGQAGFEHAQLLGRCPRQVQYPVLNVWTAICDRYDDLFSVAFVLDQYFGCQRKRKMSSRQFVHVINLTGCRSPAVKWMTIPGGYAGKLSVLFDSGQCCCRIGVRGLGLSCRGRLEQQDTEENLSLFCHITSPRA